MERVCTGPDLTGERCVRAYENFLPAARENSVPPDLKMSVAGHSANKGSCIMDNEFVAEKGRSPAPAGNSGDAAEGINLLE